MLPVFRLGPIRVEQAQRVVRAAQGVQIADALHGQRLAALLLDQLQQLVFVVLHLLYQGLLDANSAPRTCPA